MSKKTKLNLITIDEIAVLTLITMLVLQILRYILESNLLSVLAMVIGLIFVGFFVVSCILSKWRKVPADGMYIPFGAIELHISKKAKGNPFSFYKYCAETVFIAKHYNKNILFCTWHIKEDKLKEIFQESITIKELGGIEKLFNIYPAYVYRTKPKSMKNPYLKCFIEIEKVSDKTLGKLNKLIERDTEKSRW